MGTEVELERATPESVGIPADAIVAFLDGVKAEGLELHSFMLLRHGKVVAEGWWRPYRRENLHLLYSLSKSFTSAAVGFAVAEGRFGFDDEVLPFFPDFAPANPSEHLRAMRVRDLLTMSAGHDEDDYHALRPEPEWLREIFARPVPHQPGTHFLYSNSATYTVARIVQELTGQTLLEYLRPRLLEPLGIGRATWMTDSQGHQVGATGLSLTTESIAKFGQLLLQDGVWEGRQVLPRGWVAEATRGHVSNAGNSEPDWQQGYGFQFWRCRHDAFRGDGAFGQNCVVMPDQDAVFVTTAGADRLQPILDLLWDRLLPAMGDGSMQERPDSSVRLAHRLSELILAGPEGRGAEVERGCGRHYTHPQGSFTFEFSHGECRMRIESEEGSHLLIAGYDGWIEGTTSFDSEEETQVGIRAAWPDEHTLVIRIQYVLTPAHTTLTCRFQEDRVRVHLSRGGTFLPADGPEWEAFG